MCKLGLLDEGPCQHGIEILKDRKVTRYRFLYRLLHTVIAWNEQWVNRIHKSQYFSGLYFLFTNAFPPPQLEFPEMGRINGIYPRRQLPKT